MTATPELNSRALDHSEQFKLLLKSLVTLQWNGINTTPRKKMCYCHLYIRRMSQLDWCHHNPQLVPQAKVTEVVYKVALLSEGPDPQLPL
jgi:hypothetical protein